jgi:RluA family pseudouridine synthase
MKTTITEPTVLLEAVALLYPNTTRAKIRKMLTEGRVLVDETVQHKAKHPLEPGQTIEVTDRAKGKEAAPPPAPTKKLHKLNILYEDDAILVVNKPAGLLSVATNKLEPDTLHARCVNYLRLEDERAWIHIGHRLDRETSGVMVFARHERYKTYLQSQFAQREVHRTYHALVEGRPEHQQGTERAWLVEDRNLRVKKVKASFQGAKEAITHWTVEDADEEVALIHITIETGRRHQIRMAMKALDCPVVGDSLHGAETNPLSRIALHATALEFLHPESDDPVRFEARIPFMPSR